MFLNFCASCDLKVMKTFFQTVPENQFTFREPATDHEPPWTPERFAQLDYVLVLERCKNRKRMWLLWLHIVVFDSKPSLSTFINPNTVSPRENKVRLLTLWLLNTCRKPLVVILVFFFRPFKMQKSGVLLRCHLSNADLTSLDPLGTRFWWETRRMNKAIGPLLRSLR